MTRQSVNYSEQLLMAGPLQTAKVIVHDLLCVRIPETEESCHEMISKPEVWPIYVISNPIYVTMLRCVPICYQFKIDVFAVRLSASAKVDPL